VAPRAAGGPGPDPLGLGACLGCSARDALLESQASELESRVAEVQARCVYVRVYVCVRVSSVCGCVSVCVGVGPAVSCRGGACVATCPGACALRPIPQ
jgi:hypothetical protein